MFLFKRLRHRGMFSFGLGEIAEQLPRRRVFGALDRALVESLRLELHDLRLLAHDVEAERPDQPHRPAIDESPHVAPANERNPLAETLAELADQARAMLRFLAP